MSKLDLLEQYAARQLLRYAAGRNITCPHCGDVMDAAETVVLTDTTYHTVAMCAACWGHPVGNIQAGAVTVYDGRALYKSRTPTKLWRFA